MKAKGLLFYSFAILAGSGFLGVADLHPQSVYPSPPPAAPVRPVTDDYFGIKVVDFYRYMENLKDPEVEGWFKGQNNYTSAMLARIPGRQALLERIKVLDESAPARVFDVRRLPDGRYFYQKRLASEDVAKLYTRTGLSAEEKLVLDPQKYAAQGGPHWSINYYAPSFDGRYVVVGVSPGGSEDAVMHIVDLTTGKETGETIDRGWFGSPAWRPDGRSFFYNRMQKLGPDSPPTDRELKSRVYLHTVGHDPDKDPVVFGFEVSPRVKITPVDIPFVSTAPGAAYAAGLIAHGVQNEYTLYLAPLDSVHGAEAPWQKLCDVEDDVTGLDARGDDLWLLTHKDAPRFKILHTRLSHPDVAHAQVVVPQGEAVIQNISAAADALYVQELDGGIGRLVRLPADGGPVEQVKLPLDGSVAIAASDQRVAGVLLDMTSWTKARTIYAIDPKSRAVTDTRLQPAGPFDAPADLVSVEVMVPSYDGTLVPLSIVHRRGLQLDGSHPALLNGYGAYGITSDPNFDPKRLAWLERDTVYAVAHVRGGGEYGEDWHRAGMKLTKPNTWRDLIACAEYLIGKKYTTSSRLGISGGSAGGILVGRALTERPDLFAAVINLVGASNTLRAEFSPNGPPNVPEFGSVKTQPGFEDLLAMDSYHHVQDGTPYPAVLLTTGFNDPRVTPWEPAKMTARLQAATSSRKPILLRVDYEAGHGIGATKTQTQELLADLYSFLFWQTGVPDFQPQP
jgi:prolyl oligopeptidase